MGRGLLKPYNPRSYKSLEQVYLTLQWLTDTLHREAATALHQRTLAFVPLFRGRGASDLFAMESRQFYALQRLNPLAPDVVEETVVSTVASAKQNWESAFGLRMDDPEVQRQINLVCAELLCHKRTNRTFA